MCLNFIVLLKAFFIMAITIAIVFVAPAKPAANSVAAEAHLNQFSKFAEPQHDNIDDTTDSHAHMHKHSQDGEEHQHHHEHENLSESVAKIIYIIFKSDLNIIEFQSTNMFFEADLASKPYLRGIFRPPIS